MKTTFQPILLAFVCAASAALHAEHVTLTVRASGPDPKPVAEITVGDYQTAEVVSFPAPGTTPGHWPVLEITKDGTTIEHTRYDGATASGGTQTFEPVVVAGPAVVRLRAVNGGSGLCTLRITPESFPPDKTVMVPPGEHGAVVTLQSSTDLRQWTAATNGLYTGLNEARFFRIKLETAP